MKDLLSTLIDWTETGKPFAIARVIQTWGSSPRPVGSGLIISREMEMAGSVSGGCVEGAVMKEAVKAIEGNHARRLSFGVSDEEAWTVGLTCGGKIQVYLQPFPASGSPQLEVWKYLMESLRTGKSCALVTLLSEGESSSVLIDSEGNERGGTTSEEVRMKSKEALSKGKSEVVTSGQAEYFIQVFPHRSRLFIIGAAHITADLISLAHLYDFETIVIDPRGVFTRNLEFAETPDRIIEKYPSEVLRELQPDSNTYAVILSHDPKIDDDALQILLRSKVAYIGALGSMKTHEKRIERLLNAGFSKQELDRIESPIGMDIHAQGAREIALSIMGSLIKSRNR